jgi:hypothetical protein
MKGVHVVVGLLALSCSGTTLTSPRKGAGGSRASTESGGATDAQGSGGSAGGSAGNGTGGVSNACAAQSITTEPIPVDLYLMLDQSSSKSDPLPGSNPPKSRWEAAQMAVANFVNDPRADGTRPGYAPMSVGLQFFPLDGVAPGSCMADYKTPEVELALLPSNAAAIAAAIEKHQPTGFTPTAAALSGAIAHMKEWAPSHPSHAAVVVLVTAGFPTECEPQDITGIAQIARTAFATEPKVRTAVVGFNLGPGGANLDELAIAGGTNKAVLIDGGDVGSQFVDAMLGIPTRSPECRWDLPIPPMGQALDVSQVALTYTPDDTMVEAQLPKLSGLGDCALNMNNGWFYDSPTSPAQIELCPGTCGKLSTGVVRVFFASCRSTDITR